MCFYLTKIENLSGPDDSELDKKIQKFEVAMERYNRFLLNELFAQNRLGKKEENGFRLPEITQEFIYEFSLQLKESIELYYKLSFPSDSDYSNEEKTILEQLGRLTDYSPSPLVFSIYRIEHDETKRTKLIGILEKFYFIQSISPSSYHFLSVRRKYKRDFSTQYISQNMSSDELFKSITQNIDDVLKDSSILEYLTEWGKSGRSYYSWRFIRYFLFEYEMFLQSQSKVEREKIDWNDFTNENYENDFSSVEHIYPQKAHDQYWTTRFSKFTQPQKNALRNSLGNLLALSKPENSSLGNKPFNEKRDANTTGYRFGSYSENEVAFCDEWTEREILERGIKMLNFLEKRWGIKIGTEEQKMKALGLDFLFSQRSR